MMPFPDVAIGAIAAATIAALVSLLGLIISKEQKTSEFRQAWIDALRAEISRLISHANALHGGIISGANWSAMRQDYVGINEATANIRLRLNQGEASSRAVLALIEELERELAPGYPPDHLKINTIEKELVSSASTLLKAEWDRVKKGEPTFRIAKATALCLTVGLVLLGASVVAQTSFGAPSPDASSIGKPAPAMIVEPSPPATPPLAD